MSPYRDHPSSGRSFVTQYFLNAKKKLIEIFEKLDKCEIETIECIQTNNLGNEAKQNIQSLHSRSENIKRALARDNLKMAVFGRTSNGKSTVINAILGQKILPSGCGDTTNCMIQVEGTETTQAYMIRDDSGVRENISNISAADALSDDAIQDCSTILKIFWPMSSCELLSDNVVIVDTPGADKTDILDEAVEKNWLNADVHIFVVNAISGTANSETKLMKMLSEKLSIPNVFILINKWDEVIAKCEPQKMQKLQSKYIDEAVDLLTNELKAARTSYEAKKRIFFVSAEMVLNARWKNESANDKPEFFVCYNQFEKFENKCGECISNTALTTKIANHTQSGMEICSSLLKELPTLQNKVSTEISQKNQKIEEISQSIDQTNEEFQDMDLNTVISRTIRAAKEMLTKDMDHGMNCLKSFVNNFGSIPYEEQAARAWIDDFKDQFCEAINYEISEKVKSSYSKSIDDIQKALADAVIRKRKMLELLTDKEIDVEEFMAIQDEYLAVSQSEFNANMDRNLPSSSGHAPDTVAVTTTRDVFTGLTPSIGSLATIPYPPTMAVALIGSVVSGICALITSAIRKNKFAAKEGDIRSQYRAYINKNVQELVTSKTDEFSSQLKTYMKDILVKYTNIVNGRIEKLQNDLQDLNNELMELNKLHNEIEELQTEAQNIATEFYTFSQQCISQ